MATRIRHDDLADVVAARIGSSAMRDRQYIAEATAATTAYAIPAIDRSRTYSSSLGRDAERKFRAVVSDCAAVGTGCMIKARSIYIVHQSLAVPDAVPQMSRRAASEGV